MGDQLGDGATGKLNGVRAALMHAVVGGCGLEQSGLLLEPSYVVIAQPIGKHDITLHLELLNSIAEGELAPVAVIYAVI